MSDLRSLFNDPTRSAQELMEGFLADERVAKRDPFGWETGALHDRLSNLDSAAARSLGDVVEYGRNAYKDPFARLSRFSNDDTIARRVSELTDELPIEELRKHGAFKNRMAESVTNSLRSPGDHHVPWLKDIEQALSKKPALALRNFDQVRSGLQTDLSGLAAFSLVQAGQDSIYAAVDRTNSSALSALLIDKVFHAQDGSLALSTGKLQTRQDGTASFAHEMSTALLARVFTAKGGDPSRLRYGDDSVQERHFDGLFGPRTHRSAPGAHRTAMLVNELGIHFSPGGFLDQALGRIDDRGRWRPPSRQGTPVINFSLTVTRADVAAGRISERDYDRLYRESRYAVDSLGKSQPERDQLARHYGLGYHQPMTSTWQSEQVFVKDAHQAWSEMFGMMDSLIKQNAALGAKVLISTHSLSTTSSEWRRQVQIIERFTQAGGQVALLASEFQLGNHVKLSNQDLLIDDRQALLRLEPTMTTGSPNAFDTKLRARAKQEVIDKARAAGAPLDSPLVQARLAALDRMDPAKLPGFLERALSTGNLQFVDARGADVFGKGMFVWNRHGEVTAMVTQGNLKSQGQGIWQDGRMSEFLPYGQEKAMVLSSIQYSPLLSQVEDLMSRFGFGRYFRTQGQPVGVTDSFRTDAHYSRRSVLFPTLDAATTPAGLDAVNRAAGALDRLGGHLQNLELRTFTNRDAQGAQTAEPLFRSKIGFNLVLRHKGTGQDLTRLRVATGTGELILTDFNRSVIRQAVVFDRIDGVQDPLAKDRTSWRDRWARNDRAYQYTNARILSAEEVLAATLMATDQYYDYAKNTLLANDIHQELSRRLGRGPTESELKAATDIYAQTAAGRAKLAELTKTYYTGLIDQITEKPKPGRNLYGEAIKSQVAFFEADPANPFGFLTRPAEGMGAKGAAYQGDLTYYQRTQDFFSHSKSAFDPVTGNMSFNQPKGFLSDVFRNLDIASVDDEGEIMLWLPADKIFQQTQRMKTPISATIAEMTGTHLRRSLKSYADDTGRRVSAYEFNILLEVGGTLLSDSAIVNPLAIGDGKLQTEWRQQFKVAKGVDPLLYKGQVIGPDQERIRIAEMTLQDGKATHRNVGYYIDSPIKGHKGLGTRMIVDDVALLPAESSETFDRYEIVGRQEYDFDTGMKALDVKNTLVKGRASFFTRLFDQVLPQLWNPTQRKLAGALGVHSAADITMVASASGIKTASALLATGAHLLRQGMFDELLRTRSDQQLIRDIRALGSFDGTTFRSKVGLGTGFDLADPAFANSLRQMVQASYDPDGAQTIRQILRSIGEAAPHGEGHADFYTTKNQAFRAAAFFTQHLYLRQMLAEQARVTGMPQALGDLDRAKLRQSAVAMERQGLFFNSEDPYDRELLQHLIENKQYLVLKSWGGISAKEKPTSNVKDAYFARYYGSHHDKLLMDMMSQDPANAKAREALIRNFTSTMYGQVRYRDAKGRYHRRDSVVLPGEIPHLSLIADAGFERQYAAADQLTKRAERRLARTLGPASSVAEIQQAFTKVLGPLEQQLSGLAESINTNRLAVESRLEAEGSLFVDGEGHRVSSHDYLKGLQRAKLGQLQFIVPLLSVEHTRFGFKLGVAEYGVVSLDTESLSTLFPESETKLSHMLGDLRKLSLLYAENQQLFQELIQRSDRGETLFADEGMYERLRSAEQLALNILQKQDDLFAGDQIKLLTGGFKIPGRSTAPTTAVGVDLGTVVMGERKYEEILDRAEQMVRGQAKTRAELLYGPKAAKQHLQQEYYAGLGLREDYANLKALAGPEPTTPAVLPALLDKYGIAPAGEDPLTRLDTAIEARLVDAVTQRVSRLKAAETLLLSKREAHLRTLLADKPVPTSSPAPVKPAAGTGVYVSEPMPSIGERIYELQSKPSLREPEKKALAGLLKARDSLLARKPQMGAPGGPLEIRPWGGGGGVGGGGPCYGKVRGPIGSGKPISSPAALSQGRLPPPGPPPWARSRLTGPGTSSSSTSRRPAPTSATTCPSKSALCGSGTARSSIGSAPSSTRVKRSASRFSRT